MSGEQDLFTAGGEARRLMADRDWAATRSGPGRRLAAEPASAVRIVLSSRYPMLLLWGERSPSSTTTPTRRSSATAPGGDGHRRAGHPRRGLARAGPAHRGGDGAPASRAGCPPCSCCSTAPATARRRTSASATRPPATTRASRAGVLTVCSEVTEQVVGERRLRLLARPVAAGGRPAGVGAGHRRAAGRDRSPSTRSTCRSSGSTCATATCCGGLAPRGRRPAGDVAAARPTRTPWRPARRGGAAGGASPVAACRTA